MKSPPLLSATLMALATAGAWGADEVTVTLRPAPIRAPELVVAPVDVKQANITNGKVVPGHSVQVKTGQGGTQRDITVGDATLQVAVTSGKLEVVFDGKKGVLPISNLAVKQPVPLVLGEDQRKYSLAFPLVYSRGPMTSIYYRAGFTMNGKLKGRDFWLYDDNLDGKFTTGDAYQNGRCHAYAPLGKLVTNGTAVFALGAVAEDGGEVAFTPYEGETAELSVKYTGPALHAAWQGDNGLTFTTASNGDRVVVARGSYKPAFGVVLDKRGEPCGVMTGGAETLDVQDAKATYEFGAPYRFAFTMHVTAKEATASPYGHRLYGDKGEEYVGFEYEGAPKLLVQNGKALKQFGTFKPG